MRKFYLGSLALGVLLSTGCLKDPGDPTLSASKTTVAVNEEVTFTISGAEDFTCLRWGSTIGYTVVSGGGNSDKTITVKFTSAGSTTMQVAVKNCKKDADPCSGKCRDAYAETNVTVQ